MENDKIMIPEVTSRQLFNLISHIYPSETIVISKLEGIFGRSKFTNAYVTGLSIGLMTRKDSNLMLTSEGKELGRALASKNKEEQRKILQKVVLANPVLEFIYSLIKERKTIKNKEIGQKISVQFNKNWKNEASYSRYGTNCGDLLSAAGLGYYENGIYSLERIGGVEDSKGISVPFLRFKKILEVLEELRSKEKDIDTLSTSLKTKKARLSTELSNCVDLKLIQKTSTDVYAITALGRDIINPIHTDVQIRNIFAEILRKSPYQPLIKILIESKIEDVKKIGGIVLHEMKRDSSESYKETVGKIVKNWLNSSSCPETNESQDEESVEKKIITQKTTTKQKDITLKPTGDENSIFKIGSLIERIKIKNDMKQTFEEDLKELIELTKSNSSTKALSNLLSEHYTS